MFVCINLLQITPWGLPKESQEVLAFVLPDTEGNAAMLRAFLTNSVRCMNLLCLGKKVLKRQHTQNTERKAERQFSLGNYDTEKNSLITGKLRKPHRAPRPDTCSKNKTKQKKPQKTLSFHLRLIFIFNLKEEMRTKIVINGWLTTEEMP